LSALEDGEEEDGEEDFRRGTERGRKRSGGMLGVVGLYEGLSELDRDTLEGRLLTNVEYGIRWRAW